MDGVFTAGLGDAADEDLIAYAHAKGAMLVTINRDCAQLARRLRSASVIWLAVREADAKNAIIRAEEWLATDTLPNGRVLRVTKVAVPRLLGPRPIR